MGREICEEFSIPEAKNAVNLYIVLGKGSLDKVKPGVRQAAAAGSVYRARQEVWRPGLLLAGREE